MAAFEFPKDLVFNTQKIAAPVAFARDNDAASWLYLNGEAFAAMEGGMSYADVRQAVERSANVVSDPPQVLDLPLARKHVAALDELPRPTLISCRSGARASAVAYMYAGLRAGADPTEVLAAAETAGAPFCKLDEYKDWVTQSIAALRGENDAKGAAMNPNKALWEKGDFTEIAALMRESGEAVVASLGIAPPLRALDLGCGDGTTALPLARLGAEVVGIDIAKNLVEAGNRRAATAGLGNLRFEEGDATNLQGVADDTFDLTLSVFGAMFAPKPFDVAREMVRVTKPGGRVVMGNWIPNDPTSFVSQLLKISAAFTPPPPEGFVSPMTWGVESHIVARFGEAGVPKDKISMERNTYSFVSSDKGPADVIESLRRYYGPTMNAYEAAQKDGKVEALHTQLLELATSQNKSTNGGTAIPATFMRVTVRV